MRRLAIAASLLVAACDWTYHPHPASSCSSPRPSSSCTCEGETWACDDCPFDHGGGRACSDPGASCSIEGFEKDCLCTCQDGLWSCEDDLVDTVGATSHCPYVPPDAGVLD